MNRKILSGPPLNYTTNSSLGQFFFESAERFGNRLCQIDPKCNKKEIFSSVKKKSVTIALGLRKKGITSQDLIVTCSTVTLDTAIPILASFYLGAKVANLDVTLSRRQIKHLLSLVSPSVIFVEEPSLSLIE
ncbi:AMP-binding domain containing protein [Asbolus verrucosus]|uniref:AMP-binding domain containing protein n=1 Tax=Asbolus verrucosus TaxID=1661398 RepID=A0A482VYX1_ASBVE|nr:AMP-binding domain containing protein [Asbolus verrucosus]